MKDVVAALIRKNDRFLICKRPRNKKQGLLWECVGGKVEPGESKADALVRECREELNVTVCPHDVYTVVEYSYPDFDIRMTLYNAEIISGEPVLLEHEDMRWITTDQIDEFEFCPADIEILNRLKNDPRFN